MTATKPKKKGQFTEVTALMLYAFALMVCLSLLFPVIIDDTTINKNSVNHISTGNVDGSNIISIVTTNDKTYDFKTKTVTNKQQKLALVLISDNHENLIETNADLTDEQNVMEHIEQGGVLKFSQTITPLTAIEDLEQTINQKSEQE